MKKDFKNWGGQKANIHNEKQRPFFHEREVWFCTLGENIGFEQDGSGGKFLRPAVILKKFNNEVVWILPLTRNPKAGKYYFSVLLNGKASTIILSQIRLIDTKRLQYKIGMVNENEFGKLKEALVALLK